LCRIARCERCGYRVLCGTNFGRWRSSRA
jgi:hypothetical protein